MTNIANFQSGQIPFSTGLCMGSAISPLLNGVSANGQGLPISPYNTYFVTPAASATNNIALAQAVAGPLTLQLTAGAGVTLITDPASPYVGCLKLDCPRALQFTNSAGTPVVANVTIDGYCGFSSYTRRTQEQINTSAVAATTVNTNKTYMYIKSITVSGSVGGNLSVGTADILGLPFYVADSGTIVSKRWFYVSGQVALNGATAVVVTPAGVPATVSLKNLYISLERYAAGGTPAVFSQSALTDTTFSITGTAGDTSLVQWTVDYSAGCTVVAGDTTTPSLTTGDPIGKIILSTPSDGTINLRVTQFLLGADLLPTSQTVNGYIGLPPYNNLG